MGKFTLIRSIIGYPIIVVSLAILAVDIIVYTSNFFSKISIDPGFEMQILVISLEILLATIGSAIIYSEWWWDIIFYSAFCAGVIIVVIYAILCPIWWVGVYEFGWLAPFNILIVTTDISILIIKPFILILFPFVLRDSKKK